MGAMLTYNVKVAHNEKINYRNKQINNKEIRNIKNTKKLISYWKNFVLNPFLV